MIQIVVDANIILSALLGGSAQFVLLDSQFEFVTTEFTLEEVRKYIPMVARKSKVPSEEIANNLLLLPIKQYHRNYYQHMIPQAEGVLKNIDPLDADILALYYTEETYLWSEDRDFEEVMPPIRLLKTKDFF